MKKTKLIGLALTVALIVTTLFAGTESIFANTLDTPISLESGVTYNYEGTANEITYYKISSPSNGYLEVKFNDPVGTYASSYDMSVLNYKQYNLYSGSEYISQSSGDNRRSVGVSKGTYYVAIKTGNASYSITVTHHRVSEKSGRTRSKAVRISKGYSKSGIITAAQTSTSGDWYKFTIKKTQYVKFSITTKTSNGGGYGGLKMSMFQPGESYSFGTKTFSYLTPSDTIQPYTYGKGQKLAAGTYYIKLQKYSSGNGYYKIKWL